MDDEDSDDDNAHDGEDDEPGLEFDKKTHLDRPDYTRLKTCEPDHIRHGHYCCQLFFLNIFSNQPNYQLPARRFLEIFLNRNK